MVRYIYAENRLGDTIVTREYTINGTTVGQVPSIRFYDTAFTLLSVFTPGDFSESVWGNPRFSEQISDGGEFIAAPNGIFISVFHFMEQRGDFSLLIFTDRNGKFLARTVVPGALGLSFDPFGNLYFVTYTYPEFYDASSAENPIKTLFKYSMRTLLRKSGP
jgi:hypothetical protein